LQHLLVEAQQNLIKLSILRASAPVQSGQPGAFVLRYIGLLYCLRHKWIAVKCALGTYASDWRNTSFCIWKNRTVSNSTIE